ncbi:MAG TPA: hypothetical protein VGV38_23250 [Pyrinomonadaceae bacterium]|nr:hypothetical protein [Pyrinomonadaceae bacterium]
MEEANQISQTAAPPATDATEKVHRYRCPGCGADLLFEPQDGCLTCPYCGRRECIPDSPAQVQERSYEEYLRLHAGRLKTLAEGALEVRCQACGATVTFAPPEVAGECDFCGSKIVAQPAEADPVVAPEGVLPFSITREQATNALRDWLGSLFLAPTGLAKKAGHDPLGGVYLPYWTYDAHALSLYTGERGEHYYETETYTEQNAQGQTETKTRQVRRTRWYPASGQVERWFDDILIPATRALPPARLDALAPWDLNLLKPYEPAYLSGFKAQRYQLDFAEGFEAARGAAAAVIEADVRRDIGGDEQRVAEVRTHYSAVTFKHLLLPVYVGAYRFGDRAFQFVVNGRTGEVQGERPWSAWKVALLVLALLAVVVALVVLFGQNQ